jgi:hypothetical protein
VIKYIKTCIYNLVLISEITFIRYTQGQKIGKPNNYICLREQENKRVLIKTGLSKLGMIPLGTNCLAAEVIDPVKVMKT